MYNHKHNVAYAGLLKISAAMVNGSAVSNAPKQYRYPNPAAEANMTLQHPPPPPPHPPLKSSSPDAEEGLLIAAPKITVVTSARQLQQAALAGAVDIVIKAHLDLRTLSLAPNPDILGAETQTNRKRLALLYGTRQMRSLRVSSTNIST